MRALSVRQPYAEAIISGAKTVEHRSQRTRIRGRIYIYAGKKPEAEYEFERFGYETESLPTGVLIGTVELVDCKRRGLDWEWHLANSQRFKRPRKPKNRANPVWFYPF